MRMLTVAIIACLTACSAPQSEIEEAEYSITDFLFKDSSHYAFGLPLGITDSLVLEKLNDFELINRSNRKMEFKGEFIDLDTSQIDLICLFERNNLSETTINITTFSADQAELYLMLLCNHLNKQLNTVNVPGDYNTWATHTDSGALTISLSNKSKQFSCNRLALTYYVP